MESMFKHMFPWMAFALPCTVDIHYSRLYLVHFLVWLSQISWFLSENSYDIAGVLLLKCCQCFVGNGCQCSYGICCGIKGGRKWEKGSWPGSNFISRDQSPFLLSVSSFLPKLQYSRRQNRAFFLWNPWRMVIDTLDVFKVRNRMDVKWGSSAGVLPSRCCKWIGTI